MYRLGKRFCGAQAYANWLLRGIGRAGRERLTRRERAARLELRLRRDEGLRRGGDVVPRRQHLLAHLPLAVALRLPPAPPLAAGLRAEALLALQPP